MVVPSFTQHGLEGARCGCAELCLGHKEAGEELCVGQQEAGSSGQSPAGEGTGNPWGLQVCGRIRSPSREGGMEKRERTKDPAPCSLPTPTHL